MSDPTPIILVLMVLFFVVAIVLGWISKDYEIGFLAAVVILSWGRDYLKSRKAQSDSARKK